MVDNQSLKVYLLFQNRKVPSSTLIIPSPFPGFHTGKQDTFLASGEC